MRSSSKGFSVIDLLVASTTMLVLIATAVPTLTDLLASFERNAAIEQVTFDLQRARQEAIAQGTKAILTIHGDGTNYSVGTDLLPYSAPPNADVTIFSNSLPSRVTMNSSQTVIFDSRGFLIDDNSQSTTTVLSFQHGDWYCMGTIAAIGTMNVDC